MESFTRQTQTDKKEMWLPPKNIIHELTIEPENTSTSRVHNVGEGLTLLLFFRCAWEKLLAPATFENNREP
jgi:hypothetical protein